MLVIPSVLQDKSKRKKEKKKKKKEKKKSMRARKKKFDPRKSITWGMELISSFERSEDEMPAAGFYPDPDSDSSDDDDDGAEASRGCLRSGIGWTELFQSLLSLIHPESGEEC